MAPCCAADILATLPVSIQCFANPLSNLNRANTSVHGVLAGDDVKTLFRVWDSTSNCASCDVQHEVVATGWMSQTDFLTGLAVIQALPGPLFNLAAYVGACAVSITEPRVDGNDDVVAH